MGASVLKIANASRLFEGGARFGRKRKAWAWPISFRSAGPLLIGAGSADGHESAAFIEIGACRIALACVYAHAVEAVQGRTAWSRRTATLRKPRVSSRRRNATCSDDFAILVITRATVRERAVPGLRQACGRTRRHFRRKGEDSRARKTRGRTGSGRMAASICRHPPGFKPTRRIPPLT